MLRLDIKPRENWQTLADKLGFKFHTMYQEPYWDESAYYQFNLKQIEQDLEAPTEEIHQMCLDIVDRVVHDAELISQFGIPQAYWERIRDSWIDREPSLYSRLDFAYDGKSPAKLYENNADTPTSVYETGFWQWLWLQDNVDSGQISRHADQFNSLQDKLIQRFRQLLFNKPGHVLHLACCKGTEEDRGTVQYLQDCAQAAGVPCKFVYVEDIGQTADGALTDLDNQIITWIFKLYPWEFMFQEDFGSVLNTPDSPQWLEPPWKSILSNKALLPMLWRHFPNHPNLLPAYFEHELGNKFKHNELVKKPIFSREGANISFIDAKKEMKMSDGPYGQEGFIYQEKHLLPKYGPHHTLIGSWLVNDKAAGISLREDSQPITQDLSRFIPHIILG